MIFPSHKSGVPLILAVVLCLTGLLILQFFPSRTVATIWKGYRVLVVDAEEDEKDILGRLEKQGITETVSLSVSATVNTSKEAPDQPFLSEINAKRTAWFLDSEHGYRYFFLSDTPFLENKVSESFAGTEFFWHLETAEGIVYFPPVLMGFFLLSGLFRAKNKLYQIACSLPFIFLSWSCRSSPCFIATLFALYGITLALDLLCGRTLLTTVQRLRRLREQPLAVGVLLASLIAATLGGLEPLFLYCAASISSISALFLAHQASQALEKRYEKKRLHPVFRPQAIFPQARYPIDLYGGKKGTPAVTMSLMLIVAATTGLFLFAFSIPRIRTDTEKDLYIPSPSRYTASIGFDLAGYTELASLKEKGGMPDLGDFVASQWRIATFAWQRVQKPAGAPSGSSIAEYTDYTIDGNGVISEKKRVLETFNTGFIRKTLSKDATPLEKMLIAQNRFVTVSRLSGTGTRPSGGTSVLWYLFFLAIPGTVLVMRLKK